jgi:hypothetical protein
MKTPFNKFSRHRRAAFAIFGAAAIAALSACAPVPLREALNYDGIRPMVVYLEQDGSVIRGPGERAAYCATQQDGLIKLSNCNASIAKK